MGPMLQEICGPWWVIIYFPRTIWEMTGLLPQSELQNTKDSPLPLTEISPGAEMTKSRPKKERALTRPQRLIVSISIN